MEQFLQNIPEGSRGQRAWGVWNNRVAWFIGVGTLVVTYDTSEACNYRYAVVEIDANLIGLGQDRIADTLHAENVLTKCYFYPGCHRMETYRSYFPHAGLLPETIRAVDRVLVCPPAWQ